MKRLCNHFGNSFGVVAGREKVVDKGIVVGKGRVADREKVAGKEMMAVRMVENSLDLLHMVMIVRKNRG